MKNPPQGPNSPESKAFTTLPPEIFDRILEHIPTGDIGGRKTLTACALVATWWTGPSQRRLFSSVTISDSNYQRWMEGVALSRSRTRLLGYVRSLRHRCSRRAERGYPLQHLYEDSGKYLSALNNLRSLKLIGVRIQHISEENINPCFSVFRNTLTDLTLDYFIASFSAFVTLVDYFPNITTLLLGPFETKPDEGPVPPLSRPLRGKVCIRARNGCAQFFDRFATLDLKYEELVLMFCDGEERKNLGSALQLGARTVKYLRLTAEFYSEHPYDNPSYRTS